MTEQGKRKKIATKAERKVASDIGGRRVPLSGSGMEKGDVSSALLRVEVKTTESETFAFNQQDWSDIVHSADGAGQSPVFVARLSVRNVPFSVVVILRTFFKELTGVQIASLLGLEPTKSFSITRHFWDREAKSFLFRQLQMNVMHCASNEMARKKGDVVMLDYNVFVRLIKEAGL